MVDSVDFNHQTQRLQHGLQPSFFPVILDMTALNVGQEAQANINPCDSLWIPTFYDATLGQNPGVTALTPALSPPPAATISTGPNYNRFNQGGSPVGMNIFDVYDTPSGLFFQAATIFALRFNTVASPWLLWGLSNLLSTDMKAQSFASGQGDCMRSISGPIARLWFKKIAPAIITRNATPAADRVVLMSSLGYSQVTTGIVANAVDGVTEPSQSGYAVSSGGYQITTLNSVESLAQGLPQPGTLR